ncbi:MAG: hypothetical protein M3132_15220 [Actinomycetia bacterium]|nr:hypothetical protein [Actinomycetes bacterium]
MVRNRELKSDLIELNHRLDLIQTVLVVSNPESPMAANAYTGLRKTIVQSLQATQALHATIAQLDSLATATDNIEDIQVKLGELMSQYGVTKVELYEERPDAFERIGSGSRYTVTKPAYVASPEMPAIQMGVAEATNDVAPTVVSPEQPMEIDPSALESVESAEPLTENHPTGETE